MNTPEPTAIEVAAKLVSSYLAGNAETLSDQVEPVIDDPKTLGEVMAQLTVIAGESLRLLTQQTAADPETLLGKILDAHGVSGD